MPIYPIWLDPTPRQKRSDVTGYYSRKNPKRKR